MKNFSQFMEGYVASADKKVGKDGKLRPAKHIKTNAKDEGEQEVVEKLDLKKADMGDVIKDFQDSDAPQFKGKSDEKKRQMAIAAKLAADGKSKNEEVDQLDELSPATHKSYQDKAFSNAALGMAKKRMGTMSTKDAYDNEKKRYKGIDTSKYLNRKQHGVKEELNQEGVTGAVAGGVLGGMAGGPIGAAAGAYLGHKVQKAASKPKKEELKGNQHKLDKNKNGKLDADDFKKLRKEDMTPDQKAKRLELIRKTAAKLNKKAEMDAKRAMRSDPVLGRRPKDESVEEAVGTSAKYANKSGLMGGKYTSHDHAITTKNFSKYRDDRAKKRDTEHKAQDPAMQKKGYAKHMVDMQKAKKKAAARGVDLSKTARSDYHNRNGITPNRKLPEEMDNEMQKKDMMKTQLHFIKYAADEICEYIDMGGNIEEWYQNKVSKAFADFESLHSYMEGTARKDGLKEENLDELHRDTITSYSKKAVANAADASNKGDVKTVDKRIGGIKRASQQLDKKKLGEDTHVVMYHDKDGKHVNNSKPMTADKAKAHADKGNKIDKVGGKYIVKKVNEADNPPFTPDPPKKNAKPQRNSDGSITSPMSKAKQLAKQAIKNAEKTVAQHKEGVQFDEEGNILEAKNKITFHQFMGATKKKDEKQKNKDSESTDPTRL